MLSRLLPLAAAIGLCSGTTAAQTPDADPVWQDMSVAEARVLAVESGGVVRSVEDTETGEYLMAIDYPDGLPVTLKGMGCRGAGDAKRCEEFQFSAYFAFDTEAEAVAQEQALDIIWLADKRYDNELTVWRMGFVGGTTRSHMLKTFIVFVEAVWAAQAIVYPQTPDEGGASAV